MRAFNLAADQPWAITPEALEKILEIASRHEEADLEALAAKLGRPLENTHVVTMRDSTAVIPVSGPIFQKANLFTKISGATSTDALATDLSAAMTNPQITGVVMTFDSPGGAVAGTNELSGMIHDFRGKKPLVAYVGAQAASAAYWLASAAQEIVVEGTALLGSIGVVANFRKDPESKTIEIVSSVSPHKRDDPTSEGGRARIQALVDSLGELFVERVAENLNVPVKKVLADFGKGGLMHGRNAVDAGMAHRLGSFEGVIRELQSKRGRKTISLPATKTGATMNEQEIAALQAENASVKAALETERKRADKAEAQAAAGTSAITGQLEALTAKLNRAEADNAATAQALAASEDARQLTAFIAQGEKELPHTPGTPEEKGKMLKSLYSSMPKEQADSVFATMKQGDTALASQLKEKGSSGARSGGSAQDQLLAIANEIASKEGITVQAATTKAIQRNPALYEASLKG